MGEFPEVAVGVGEVSGVAAPEDFLRLFDEGGSGRGRFGRTRRKRRGRGRRG